MQLHIPQCSGQPPTTKGYGAQHVNSAQFETLEGAFYIKAIEVKYLSYNPR